MSYAMALSVAQWEKFKGAVDAQVQREGNKYVVYVTTKYKGVVVIR